jgi:hypothetical protein
MSRISQSRHHSCNPGQWWALDSGIVNVCSPLPTLPSHSWQLSGTPKSNFLYWTLQPQDELDGALINGKSSTQAISKSCSGSGISDHLAWLHEIALRLWNWWLYWLNEKWNRLKSIANDYCRGQTQSSPRKPLIERYKTDNEGIQFWSIFADGWKNWREIYRIMRTLFVV